MNYSNGFDLDTVLPALVERVGWRSEGLVRSFESFHSLCTESNLKDVQPTDAIADDAFEIFKVDIKKDVIQRCLSSVFNQPEYLEQVLLHNRISGQQRQIIENNDLFCGIRFRIAPDFGISTVIKTVTLLFDSNVILHLYLYEDGNPEPIADLEVDAVANKPTVYDIADLILNYANSGTTVFYLGYYQNDIGAAKAIREQVSWTNTKVFSANSFSMPRTEINDFNPSYGYDVFGLTAEVHAFKDYTLKIARSAHLFDEVIGLSMVYSILEMIVSTTRSNARERILKGAYEAIELKHYLYGAIPAQGVSKITGLNEVIAEKFKQVREVFYPVPKAQTVSLCL